MRPSMTRECDERMWNLAYRLAQSGEHQNYQAIEWELRAFGYPRAPQLLCCERVREKLDGMCAEARKRSSAVARHDFDSHPAAGVTAPSSSMKPLPQDWVGQSIHGSIVELGASRTQ
jgi:hypothetical protein